MTLIALLGELRSLGVALTLENDQLRVAAPKGTLTPALQLQLRENKEALLALLRASTAGAVTERFEPIVAHDPALPTPLSLAQHRLWFLEELRPGTAFNNLPIPWKIRGVLDIDALSWAIAELGRRHDILRGCITERDGQPVQTIVDAQLALEHADVSSVPVGEREAHVLRQLDLEAARPFDLRVAPLIRFKLLRASPEENWLIYVTNHVVFDGWSHDIVLRELSQLYAARTAGTPVPAAPPVRFTDYVRWHEAWLNEPAQQKQLEDQARRLSGMPVILELPTDFARPAEMTYRATQRSWRIEESLLTDLRRVARAHGATLNMLMLASIELLLARYSGQPDFGVGMAVNGRTRPECEELIGMYVNTLVVRSDVAAGGTFGHLLQRVRDTSLHAISNQNVPFDRLVNALRPPRERNRTPLYQAFFSYQEATQRDYHLGNLSLEQIPLFSGESGTDITFWMRDHTAWAVAGIELFADLFSEATASRWLRSWQCLLEAIARTPDVDIRDLPVVAAEDRDALHALALGPVADINPALVHEQFADVARRHPTRIAISFEETSYTFADLADRATQIATVLRARGVEADTLVGICLPRGFELVATMLGVLEAGAAYLPLDPAYPQERLHLYIEDSRAAAVITSRTLAAQLDLRADLLLNVDEDLVAGQRPDASGRTGVRTTPDHLAYVLYTSGSTGRPKGVMVTHRNVSNFFAAMRERVGLDDTGVWLAATSTSFDISVLEILGCLCHGREIVLVADLVLGDAADQRYSLANQATRYGVTHFQCTPSQARILMLGDDSRAMLQRLDQLILGGEPIPQDLGDALAAIVPGSVINGYGPTEVTVYATMIPVRRGVPITIGTPIANTAAYIVDPAGHLVPFGASGELALGGPSVARGYLHRQDLTDERFLPNPHGPAGVPVLYRTGDVARFDASGHIVYLGRNDAQCKVRGYRIELGEIETRLRAVPGVREAVVTTYGAHTDKRLVAYIEASEDVVGTDGLRDALRATLPDYMVPSAFVRMASLPLTPNGKVDKKALPAPDEGLDEATGEYIPPETVVEQALSGIWADVLGVARIGRTDDFFSLGGHSLLAVRIFNEINNRFGVRLPLAALFEGPTLQQLAASIEKEMHTDVGYDWSTVVPIRTQGSLTPFFCAAGVGGNPLNLLHISANMDEERPFYGLQYRGVDGKLPPHRNIRDMAVELAADIRRVQPSGPYFIGGYSFGGVPAYEVACMLEEQGEQVGLLVLLDTFAPTLPSWTATERVVGHLKRLMKEGPSYVLQRYRNRSLRRQTAREKEQAVVDLDSFEARNDLVEMACHEALQSYVPRRYGGNVLLLQSQLRLGPADGIGYRTHESNGWRTYLTPGRLTIEQVHYNHLDIVSPGAAPATARIISDALASAELRVPVPSALETVAVVV